jgi:hypothetical protein
MSFNTCEDILACLNSSQLPPPTNPGFGNTATALALGTLNFTAGVAGVAQTAGTAGTSVLLGVSFTPAGMVAVGAATAVFLVTVVAGVLADRADEHAAEEYQRQLELSQRLYQNRVNNELIGTEEIEQLYNSLSNYNTAASVERLPSFGEDTEDWRLTYNFVDNQGNLYRVPVDLTSTLDILNQISSGEFDFNNITPEALAQLQILGTYDIASWNLPDDLEASLLRLQAQLPSLLSLEQMYAQNPELESAIRGTLAALPGEQEINFLDGLAAVPASRLESLNSLLSNPNISSETFGQLFSTYSGQTLLTLLENSAQAVEQDPSVIAAQNAVEQSQQSALEARLAVEQLEAEISAIDEQLVFADPNDPWAMWDDALLNDRQALEQQLEELRITQFAADLEVFNDAAYLDETRIAVSENPEVQARQEFYDTVASDPTLIEELAQSPVLAGILSEIFMAEGVQGVLLHELLADVDFTSPESPAANAIRGAVRDALTSEQGETRSLIDTLLAPIRQNDLSHRARLDGIGNRLNRLENSIRGLQRTADNPDFQHTQRTGVENVPTQN